MKKTIVPVLLSLVLFTSCGAEPSPPVPTSVAPSSSAASSAPSSSEFISSCAPASSITEVDPEKDEVLSAELSKYMLDSFGGMGKPEYAASAASWYKYIQSLEVYKQDEKYFEVLTLTEKPIDSKLILLLSQSLTEESIDFCAPIINDAGAALGLDELDLCIVGEDILKIMDGADNISVIYSSLYAYNIPVYSYLATEIGLSEADIRDNINQITGAKIANAILNHMSADFSGSFKGLSLKSTKTAAMAAMMNFDNDNFKSNMVEKIIVKAPDGKELSTYENTSFIK